MYFCTIFISQLFFIITNKTKMKFTIPCLAVLSLTQFVFSSDDSRVISLQSQESERVLTLIYEKDCATLDSDDKCCVGYKACPPSGTGILKVTIGSCRGIRACNLLASSGGSVSVGQYSCVGELSCWHLPSNLQFPKIDVVIGSNSCDSYQACRYIGDRNGYARVGDESCRNGEQACIWAGDNDGHAEIGETSCAGNKACHSVGYRNGKGIVGSNSCNDNNACFCFGRNWEGIIGDGSCNGEYACYQEPYAELFPTRELVIGNEACNCNDCCRCLEHGDIVQNGHCNVLGNDECCIDASTRGNKDLKLPLQIDATDHATVFLLEF